jgi:hypothetical protein
MGKKSHEAHGGAPLGANHPLRKTHVGGRMRHKDSRAFGGSKSHPSFSGDEIGNFGGAQPHPAAGAVDDAAGQFGGPQGAPPSGQGGGDGDMDDAGGGMAMSGGF